MPIAISALTQTEFINICQMRTRDLETKILSRLSYKKCMEFRRELQVSLTEFARGKPILNLDTGDVFDVNRYSHEIQYRALQHINYIEGKVRNAYINSMRPKIIMSYPEFAKNPAKVKSLAKMKWNKFCAKLSY